MAVNPKKIMEMKGMWDAFTNRHPKFPQFMSAVKHQGITEGTVIDVQVTTPDGKVLSSNLRVTQEDIDAVKSL